MLALIERAPVHAPNERALHYQHGLVLQRLNRSADAREAWVQALRADSDRRCDWGMQDFDFKPASQRALERLAQSKWVRLAARFPPLRMSCLSDATTDAGANVTIEARFFTTWWRAKCRLHRAPSYRRGHAGGGRQTPGGLRAGLLPCHASVLRDDRAAYRRPQTPPKEPHEDHRRHSGSQQGPIRFRRRALRGLGARPRLLEPSARRPGRAGRTGSVPRGQQPAPDGQRPDGGPPEPDA